MNEMNRHAATDFPIFKTRYWKENNCRVLKHTLESKEFFLEKITILELEDLTNNNCEAFWEKAHKIKC